MIRVEIDSRKFLANLGSTMESSIFNMARSDAGYPYFWPVDLGRGPVFPKRAKALRIRVGRKKFIFRKKAGPAPPRNITGKALERLVPDGIVAARQAVGPTLRNWFASFLNRLAVRQATSFARATPRRFTGRLAKSYQVRRTI